VSTTNASLGLLDVRHTLICCMSYINVEFLQSIWYQLVHKTNLLFIYVFQ